ncbi:hypothetical protein IBL26_23295 [Roseomonas aerophila]|uniref:Uncharacterized protein n=1 Tax=Teichococcus aerophilus TaxID=1224513 RepID=A0ABR7RUW5_9PROT|nr:hypothetical protein [Pseudoroseomonas aerophila]MBC9209782.1 hypothetical protein [Pseudoroseomonas aerophila]
MVARLVILPLLAGLALAGCSSTRTEDSVLGARGSTVNTIRGGEATQGEVLRPEPGNIWSEGLQSSQPTPTR